MKSKKALRLGVLVLSLGALVGCGDEKKPEDDNIQPEQHVCEADKEAGLQSNSTKHWYKCKDSTCKLHVEEAAHDLGEAQKTKDPTCTVAGSQKQICKVCNYEKVSAIPATGHKYEQVEGADKVVWETEASCTEGGVGTKTCTVCQEVENVTVDALGHVYEQVEGADKVVWTQNQDCTHAGIGTKTCTRCSAVANVNVDALGHDLQLIDPKTPVEGQAAVNLYECQRDGCDETFLGFKANEASTESLARLDIDDDGGARFKGRPIGNAIPLPQVENGDHTPVWDKNETGDFFEYKFELTADQIEALDGGTCRIYCEAMAAQWMSENNLDFWACAAGATKWDPQSEWTPGMYIDDAHPGNHVDGDNPNTEADETETGYEQGQFILDYRYILYVDGQPVQFDSRVTNPVKSGANTEKRTYVLPYAFHLHEGLNTISLRMAGGYLSTFYNFTFRPFDEDAWEVEYAKQQAEKEAAEAAKKVFKADGDKIADLQPVKNDNGQTGYEMVAADCDGQNAPVSTNKDSRLGKNDIFTDSWDITGIASGQYDVYVKGAYSSGNGGSYWSGKQNMDNMPGEKESNNGNPYNPGARYTFKVDDLDGIDAATDKTYADCGLTQADAGAYTTVALANVGIPEGATSFKMTNNNNGYSIWVYEIRLVRTGKYIKPGVEVTFNEGKAKIECENFSEISEAMDPVTEGELTYISIPSQKWPQVATEYNLKFAADVHVKLVLRTKYISAAWGNNGAAELYIDGVRTKAPNSDNIAQDLECKDEWIDAESVAFDLTAGTHVIKLQGPGGCEVMWDYFELVEVAK